MSPESQVSWDDPDVTDNLGNDVDVVCVPQSGSVFQNANTETVTCTATDDAGNEASCTFLVSVGMYCYVFKKLRWIIHDLTDL